MGITKVFGCGDTTEQKGQREEIDCHICIFAKDRNHKTVPSREA